MCSGLSSPVVRYTVVRKPRNPKQSMCDLLLRLLVHEAGANDAFDPLPSRAHVEEARDHDVTMRIVRSILVCNLIGCERSWDAHLRGYADVGHGNAPIVATPPILTP